jgi:hypothetical protein
MQSHASADATAYDGDGLSERLDDLVGAVDEYLFDVLGDTGDLIAAAGLGLDFGELLE